MDQSKYNVSFSGYSEGHFRKSFRKKYKSKWLLTEKAIIAVCERIDTMLLTNRADLIQSMGNYQLVKLDFAVVDTQMSPKSTGYRCILFVDNNKGVSDKRIVEILLVYSKDKITGSNETAWWKGIIKDQFAEISEIFGL